MSPNHPQHLPPLPSQTHAEVIHSTHTSHLNFSSTSPALAKTSEPRVPPIYASTATTPPPKPTPALPSLSHTNSLAANTHATQTTVHASQSPQQPSTINTHNTELQMVKVHINNTKHITIANINIPPRDSTSTHYKTADTDIQHCIQHITNIPYSVLTGDGNAHSTLWHSHTDDHREQLIADVIINSDHLTLKTPTRVPTPHYNKHLHLISPRCPTHYTIGHRGQFNAHYHQTTYDASPQLTYNMTTYYKKTDGYSPTTRKLTGHNSRKTQSPLSFRPPYPPIYTLPT